VTRALLVLALLAGAAHAEPRHGLDRLQQRFSRANRFGGSASALLRLGLNGDCEGVAPSGVTYSRTSTVTCTRADGSTVQLANGAAPAEVRGLLVESSGTNLALYSEAFDNAAWAKGASSTIAPDTTTAPDGALTADTFSTVGGGNGNIFKSLTVTAGTVYTASVYIKRGTWDWYRLMFYDGNTAQARAWFNLSTGALGTTGAGGTATYTGARIESLGGGWYRVSVSGSITTTTGYWQLTPQDGDGSTAQSSNTSAYIWGAQLEASPFATSYIPTTGTAVTRAAAQADIPRPTALSMQEGCAKVCVTPQWSGANPATASQRRFLGMSDNVDVDMFVYADALSANVRAYNATVSPSVAGDYQAGVTRCYLTEWSASAGTLSITNLSSGAKSIATGFTGFRGLGTTLHLGRTGPGNFAHANVSGLVLGSAPGRCQ
jgi:hypothetical protein